MTEAATLPTPDSTHQLRVVRKTPEALCNCLRALGDGGLIRFMESAGPDGFKVVPVLDNHRRGKHGQAQIINYCPYCGKPAFDVFPIEPTPEVPN